MTVDHEPRSIAYFISPHGFGHAARASAVMRALQETNRSIYAEVFTTVPRWFFEDSMGQRFTHHDLQTDIGLIQETPLRADFSETIRRLDRFIPFERAGIEALAEKIERLRCELVVCDIAPMGIAVARASGLPSLLVENFTWDWVYAEYTPVHRGLMPHADYLGALFRRADYHVQTDPVCSPAEVDLTVSPVSRRSTRSPRQIRKMLGIPDGSRMLLITMGGIPGDYPFIMALTLPDDVHVVIPGGAETFKRDGRVIYLPHRSSFFHPDLVHAADGVIGKVGYSTVAEVYRAGVPFGFIKRSHFRESDILADYIHRHMHGFAIEEHQFTSGEWASHVDRLLSLPRTNPQIPNGALRVADFIRAILEHPTDSPRT